MFRCVTLYIDAMWSDDHKIEIKVYLFMNSLCHYRLLSLYLNRKHCMSSITTWSHDTC